MESHIRQRQAAAIRRALGELLVTEVKDPHVGLAQVNGVELNRDGSVAEVYVAFPGGDARRALRALRRARGFLQGRLDDLLHLRQTPELRFRLDETLARSEQVDRILEELRRRGELTGERERLLRLTLADLVPPADLMAALRRGRRFWVVPHWNPDPDAMGGALALAAALNAAGREAVVFRYPDPPIGLVDLPGFADAVPAAEAAALLAESPPDTLVMVDCHRRERAGELADVLARVPAAWCVDHHLVTRRQLPLPGWVEPKASAACLLVLRVVEELAADPGPDGEPFAVDHDMAANLFAGIYADTGGFRFANTLPVTFAAAERLARRGVDTAAVAEQVLHRRRREAVALLERVLRTFRYHAGGKVLTLRADQAMLRETGATLADTEGMVTFATGIVGVRYVAFLKELPDGRWRVSLRATGPDGDVQQIAARHGGGGHRQAAGCTLTGDGDLLEAELAAALAALP